MLIHHKQHIKCVIITQKRKSFLLFQFSTFVDFKNLLPYEEVLSELVILCDVFQGMISFIVISYHSTPHNHLYGYQTSRRGFNYSLTVQTITLMKYPIIYETSTVSMLKCIFSTRYHIPWLLKSCIMNN